jgi:7-carboxy-7-deazaguanine synthase
MQWRLVKHLKQALYMNLNVNEIFYSLQGEGGRTGEASIFIRLAKCNLSCSFCDTDFNRGVKMRLEDIADSIKGYPSCWIIWTGGEPALQLKDETVAYFKDLGYKQAIETNGTKRLPAGLDYITCSPKQNFEKIKELIPQVDELRFPIAKGDALPNIADLPVAKKYLLSPIFDNNTPVKENIEYCVNIIKQNPLWALSIQVHKLIGIQ